MLTAGVPVADCCAVEDADTPHDIFYVQVDSPSDFADVFSPPRVCPVAERKGLKGLRSYDLTSGWNFLDAECRRKCIADIEQYKPEVVLRCPPCGPFSALQMCSWEKQDPRAREQKMIEAWVLSGFAMQVCELQHRAGRKFLFEQPANATSWSEECVMNLRQKEGVHEVHLDQCEYRLKDPQNHKFFRKRTRLLTNCEEMKGLQVMCTIMNTKELRVKLVLVGNG